MYRKYKSFSDINITPMVDVVLVLLIIFMVTVPMLIRGMKVNLPSAHSGKVKLNKEDIVISINRSGRLFVDRKPITITELKEMLVRRRPENVIIKADKAVAYGAVIKIIDTLKGMNVENVALATKPLKR